MKILVLSPGEPTVINSGLGVVANALNRELGNLVELIIIQPNNNQGVNKSNQNSIHGIDIKNELLSDANIINEETKILIDAQLDAYHYNTPLKKEGKEVEKQFNLIKNELENYSTLVLQEVKKLEFDLIYAHDWITLETAVKIKERTGKPLVAHIHSLDFDRGAGSDKSFVYDIEFNALHKADAIIAVSQYTSTILEKHYNISPEKIKVVYNAIDVVKLPEVEKTIPDKLVLFVGRLSGQKGPGLFMQIAEDLLSKRDDVRFVLVGDGELLKSLIEQGANPVSNGKIHFTGSVEHEEVLKLYAMADVYCMPSVSEPFGLSALEAASAGVPVVLSSQSGAAEVLKGALLADHWEVDAFVRNIEQLLNEPKMAREAVVLNYDCLKGMTWNKAAKQVYQVFIDAVN